MEIKTKSNMALAKLWVKIWLKFSKIYRKSTKRKLKKSNLLLKGLSHIQ